MEDRNRRREIIAIWNIAKDLKPQQVRLNNSNKVVKDANVTLLCVF